jgi:hypothetical protein
MATVTEVVEAFKLFYGAALRRDFSKSLYYVDWNERDILPSLRLFLLGYFGNTVKPESRGNGFRGKSKHRKVDFLVGGIAVEVAVRAASDSSSKLSAATNRAEIQKLIRHRGKSLLVLLDFSRSPLSPEALEKYKSFNFTKTSQGKYSRSPYNVAYFARRRFGRTRKIVVETQNIRMNRILKPS